MCHFWLLSLTWRLRERSRLLSKWPRLASSLPRRSPSTVLPPMVPYSTHRPSKAKQLTFCSQFCPPMQSRMMSTPFPVEPQWFVVQVICTDTNEHQSLDLVTSMIMKRLLSPCIGIELNNQYVLFVIFSSIFFTSFTPLKQRCAVCPP